MPKVVRKEIVKLISIKDREGNEYDEANRRSKFIGGQGLVVFCESLHKLPGEIFSIFYYSHDLEPDTMTFDSVTTGYGEIIRDEKSGIVFRTKNSSYHYDFETITLSDNLKKALLEYGESLEQKYEIREMKKTALMEEEKMREKERIEPFLENLGVLWKKYYPDLRFGQMMFNFICAYGDPFYLEEDQFIAAFEAYCKGEDPKAAAIAVIEERLKNYTFK